MDDQMNQVGVGPGEAARGQGSGAVAPGRGGRMSRQRKSAAVLRLLRGEDLETVSRELGVTAATRHPAGRRAGHRVVARGLEPGVALQAA